MTSFISVLHSELITISANELNGKIVNSVSLREVHGFVESKQHFADWAKDRLADYREGIDFTVNHNSMKNPLGGRPQIDYIVSLNTAKHISLIERNVKGRQLREDLIDKEEKYILLLEENMRLTTQLEDKTKVIPPKAIQPKVIAPKPETLIPQDTLLELEMLKLENQALREAVKEKPKRKPNYPRVEPIEVEQEDGTMETVWFHKGGSNVPCELYKNYASLIRAVANVEALVETIKNEVTLEEIPEQVFGSKMKLTKLQYILSVFW